MKLELNTDEIMLLQISVILELLQAFFLLEQLLLLLLGVPHVLLHQNLFFVESLLSLVVLLLLLSGGLLDLGPFLNQLLLRLHFQLFVFSHLIKLVVLVFEQRLLLALRLLLLLVNILLALPEHQVLQLRLLHLP